MMKDHVFGHGTTTRMFGNPESFRIVKLKEEKRKGKGKGKGGGTGRTYVGEEQAQDFEWWSEEDSVWWSEGKRGKKGSSTTNNYFSESDFRTYHPEKSTGNEYHPYKGRGKDQKRKKTRKGISPFEPCQPPDARCSGSWLHTVNWIKSTNQKVPECMRCIIGITTEFLSLQQVLCICQL